MPDQPTLRSQPFVTGLVAAITVAAAVVSLLLVRAWMAPSDEAVAAGSASSSGGHVTLDLDGRRVLWDEAPDLTRARAESTGGRFDAPRQRLSVPLLRASVVDNLIVPPTLTDAYVIRDYGRPGDRRSGLVVVAMHSVRGGRGPGNAFFEPGSARTLRVGPGDPLIVNGSNYEVTAVRVDERGTAATDLYLWDRWHERGDELAVITCLLDPRLPMTRQDNLVVLARRV